MSAHRRIGRDGYAECYACGTVVEYTPDGDTDRAFDLIPCKPGGWDHPPYVYPPMETNGGFEVTLETAKVTFETCAAHPYEACEAEAREVASGYTGACLAHPKTVALDAFGHCPVCAYANWRADRLANGYVEVTQ